MARGAHRPAGRIKQKSRRQTDCSHQQISAGFILIIFDGSDAVCLFFILQLLFKSKGHDEVIHVRFYCMKAGTFLTTTRASNDSTMRSFHYFTFSLRLSTGVVLASSPVKPFILPIYSVDDNQQIPSSSKEILTSADSEQMPSILANSQ